MLTVASVLSPGPIYTSGHVERLARMVAEHMTQPYRFVCLSDIDVPCERIPLTQDWPGWWSKIELYKPGRFEGRVLYLDLDVMVVGSLDEIADYPAPFAAIQDYERHTINSSVMAWDAGVADRVYTDFTPDIMERPKYGGDQSWVTECMHDAATFPRNWCPSFKHQCRYSVPNGAKVIVFHGAPKPWDLIKDLALA